MTGFMRFVETWLNENVDIVLEDNKWKVWRRDWKHKMEGGAMVDMNTYKLMGKRRGRECLL